MKLNLRLGDVLHKNHNETHDFRRLVIGIRDGVYTLTDTNLRMYAPSYWSKDKIIYNGYHKMTKRCSAILPTTTKREPYMHKIQIPERKLTKPEQDNLAYAQAKYARLQVKKYPLLRKWIKD